MRKNKKIIIIVLVLFISIGFAYLSTNLFINGTSIVKRTTWDVHFNNIQNETTTGDIDNHATISTDSRSVDFEVSFDTPGEEYSFNVDIVNNGNLDAMLESYTLINPDENSYLEWEVMYDDGISFNKYDLLSAGQTETLYIKLKFIEDVELENLPTEYDYSYSLKFIANYVQADSNANTRVSHTYNITYSLDGGTITNNPTTYNSRLGATIPNPTKEGYTFLGWTGGKNIFDNNNYYANAIINDSGDDFIALEMLGGGNTRAFNKTRYQCNKTYTITSRSDLVNSRYLFRIRKLDDSDWMNNTDFTPTNTSWTYNQYYQGWWINNTDVYGNETIHIPEGLYWELGVGFQTVPDLVGTIQNIYDIMLVEGTEAGTYETYQSTPITNIVLSPGTTGNRTYTAVWEEN